MQKQKIREEIQKKWNALSREEIERLTQEAAEEILKDEKVRSAEMIFSYKALKDEFLLGEFLEKAKKR